MERKAFNVLTGLYLTLQSGIATFLLMLTGLLILCFSCFSQDPVGVSEPKLKKEDNIVLITYDFLQGGTSDIYRVQAEITDVFGNMVHRLALSGDIGRNVSGGRKKTITWDLGIDRIYMEDDITVKINAWPAMFEVTQAPAPPQSDEPAEEPVRAQPVDEQEVSTEIIPINRNRREESPDKVKAEPPVYTRKSGKAYNRGGIIIQSLVWPGLGLSRMKRKPHWLKGLLGYGCIGGSVYLNREASTLLTTIPDNQNFLTQSDLFQKAVRMDNISEGLAYAAIGMWVIDFLWTVSGSSILINSEVYSDRDGFTINTGIDPISHTPLIGISFRF